MSNEHIHLWLYVTSINHPKRGFLSIEVCQECGQGRWRNDEPEGDEFHFSEMIGDDDKRQVSIASPIPLTKIIEVGRSMIGDVGVSTEPIPWAWALCPNTNCYSCLQKAGSQIVTSAGIILSAQFRCKGCGMFFEAKYNGMKLELFEP